MFVKIKYIFLFLIIIVVVVVEKSPYVSNILDTPKREAHSILQCNKN